MSLGVFTRRPAVVAALLLTTGILLHDQLPQHPHVLLVVCAIFALLATPFIGRRFLCSICISSLVTLLGVGIAQREHFQYLPTEIGLFATDEPHLAEIEVRIIDDPQIVVGPPGAPRPLPPKQIITADVLRLKTVNGWTTATGRLPIAIDQPSPSLQAGQIVRLLGMLQRPRAAMNPGEFDWAAYYRQQRILATFNVTRIGNVHILADTRPNRVTWLRIKTHHLLAAGFTENHSTQYALLDALALGNRDPELRDIQEEFKQTGMGYQLNVSGMHIALLAAVVYWLCRIARLRPRWTLLITTGFVLLYATISLPSHSGIRSVILCVVVATAMVAGRATDRPQLVSLAAIGMLLWHPMDIYSVGFQLSFAVIIAFVRLRPPLEQWLETLQNPDDLANPNRPKLTAARRIRIWIAWCLQYGLLAWLATLPLVAYYFGAETIWSILGSLFLFPFVVASLFTGVLKIIFTLLWPRCAAAWATSAQLPVQLLQWGVHCLTKLPGSSVLLPAPPIWLIVVYYLLLLAPLLPYWKWISGRRRWLVRLLPLVGTASIFSIALWLPAAPAAIDQLKITLLCVGAGQCGVVEPPGGHSILIDAGSTTVNDVAKKILEPFLRSEGQSQVNGIFLSHGDFDHISAAGEIATSYGVHQVFTSYHFVKNSVGNLPDLALLDELEKLNLPPRKIALGDHIPLGGGAAIDVLWPPKIGDLNSNNAGLVLRLTYAGRSILFPADIQDPAFIGVLKNAKALKSDVLVAPHHGSSEDLTPAFLSAVHPDIILSSNAGRLSGKQKRFETMTDHIPLYRTPECGAITVTIKRDGTISVSTFVVGAKPKQ